MPVMLSCRGGLRVLAPHVSWSLIFLFSDVCSLIDTGQPEFPVLQDRGSLCDRHPPDHAQRP